MKLTNETGIPAILFRTIIDETRFAAAVIARITYDLDASGLRISSTQPWIVSAAPWEGPEGPMPSDEVFYRGGTDLLVFGKAYGADGRPCRFTTVRVRCEDDLDVRLFVYGHRIWEKQRGKYVPSEPEPFESMPLTLANAFGGKTIWDELEVANQVNPEGKGYCLEQDQVTHTALPNIEDPNHLISHWQDTPDPVGVGICPMGFGPKLQQTVIFDKKSGVITELKPAFFNAAFPQMILPKAVLGKRIRIEGMSPDKPIGFELPETLPTVQLRFGETEIERPTYIDQIGVAVESKQVFITYRYPFRYEMRRREKRSCTLRYPSMIPS